MLLQTAATIAMGAAETEEDKKEIRQLLKGSIYLDVLPIDKATEYGGKKELLSSAASYIPQFVVAADRAIEMIGGWEQFGKIYEKFEEQGLESLTQDEQQQVLLIDMLLKSTQLIMNLKGMSIPMYNKLKVLMRDLKEEVGVEDK
jgi:hypothetical protein